MNPVTFMVAGSLGTSLVVTALLGDAAGPEVVLGMLGPLVAVTVSWVLIDRVHRRNPAEVTSQMIGAFGAKMVFFAAYVFLVVGVLDLRPVMFVVSFTCYFLTLYFVEALLLNRLSANDFSETSRTSER